MRLVQEINQEFEVEIFGMTLYVPVDAVAEMVHEAFAYHGLAGDIATGHQQSVAIDHLDIFWADITIHGDEGVVLYVTGLNPHQRWALKQEIKKLVVKEAEERSAWSEED